MSRLRAVSRSVTSMTSMTSVTSMASMASMASFRVPSVGNEPNNHYGPGSADRKALQDAIARCKSQTPLQLSLGGGSKHVNQQQLACQTNPATREPVAEYANASAADVEQAIAAALEARTAWAATPFAERASIFLKAADLISHKYRYELMAWTMLGQGKTVWQAEIDAAAELCDFFRFGVKYAEELYAQQPVHHSPGVWNRLEYRPLEGFVYAISPFNFTAIGGNLAGAPALMGNVVVWKPSPSAVASNWLVHQILLEAGLPAGVIQFVPGDAEEVTAVALGHPQLAGLHFTGSTAVFRSLYGRIGAGVAAGSYRSYPRIVGETGGKNFHLVHRSADLRNAVVQTVRGAFEYQGQKCSATSRVYVAASIADSFLAGLVDEVRQLRVGNPVGSSSSSSTTAADLSSFCGPVIHEAAFRRLAGVIDAARDDPDLQLLVGGSYDDSQGWYIHPTVYRTSNPNHPLLHRELFGPVLVVYVYDDSSSSSSNGEDASFARICRTIDESGGGYGLTGSVFAQDRAAIQLAEHLLRNAAGNFYINCKSTGAVVGQQPFGGARASGTNDKAGSATLLSRFVSVRSIKEEFLPTYTVAYPSNQ